MTEWRDVVGYPGYQVSDDGQARSTSRLIVRSDGQRQRCFGKVLSARIDASGYCKVSLYRDGERGGSRRKHSLHVLILEAFVGPRPAGMKALHYDDDPQNNALSNLRWGTQSENTFDKVRNGNHPMARRTHCKHGHEYTEANTYRYPKTGYRACRTCISKR